MPLCPKPSQGDLLKLSPRTTTLTFGLLLAGLLTGCAATGTSAPAASPSASVPREAAPIRIKGVNFQIVNNSGTAINLVNLETTPMSIVGTIEDGGTGSASGKATFGEDVEVVFGFPDGDTLKLRGYNGAMFNPEVREGRMRAVLELCGPNEFAENAEGNYYLGVRGDRGVTIKRLPDDDWKQFLITFTASKSASSTTLCPENPESKG